MREALSAAQRGHDTVVLDLPRLRDAVVDEVVARCDRVLVVVAPTVAGVASAARVWPASRTARALRLVVRGHGVEPRDVARVTGVPVVACMADQRGLAESIDLGLGPVRSRRGPLGRAALEVLGRPPRRCGRPHESLDLPADVVDAVRDRLARQPGA